MWESPAKWVVRLVVQGSWEVGSGPGNCLEGQGRGTKERKSALQKDMQSSIHTSRETPT